MTGEFSGGLAVAYARVSTEDQAKGYSLQSQVEACARKARSLGVEKVVNFIDAGVSGSVLARPGLEAARDRIRTGGVTFFVCLDPDRLARNLSHQLLITEEIEKHGAKLEFVDFQWMETAEGKLFYSLRGAISEYEKEKIRERTLRGKRAKAAQHRLTHNPQVFGYDYDVERDILLVNPVQAEVVRRIFLRFTENGETGLAALARWLTELGYPTPRGRSDWSRTTVRRILSNQTYTGVLHLQTVDTSGVKNNRYSKPEEKKSRRPRPREEWVAVSVPAIIDGQTFERAQKELERIRRHRPGTSKYPYLLSGIVRCAVCGHTMHGDRITRRNRHGREKIIPYYVCTAKSPGVTGHPRCRSHFVRAQVLEEMVWSRVVAWVSGKGTAAVQFAVPALAAEAQSFRQQAEMLETSVAEVKKQRDRDIFLFEKDLISAEEAETRLLSWNGQIDRLYREQVALEREAKAAAARAGRSPNLQALLDAFCTGEITLEAEEKSRLLRLVLEQVVVNGRRVTLISRANLPDDSTSGAGCERGQHGSALVCGDDFYG